MKELNTWEGALRFFHLLPNESNSVNIKILDEAALLRLRKGEDASLVLRAYVFVRHSPRYREEIAKQEGSVDVDDVRRQLRVLGHKVLESGSMPSVEGEEFAEALRLTAAWVAKETRETAAGQREQGRVADRKKEEESLTLVDILAFIGFVFFLFATIALVIVWGRLAFFPGGPERMLHASSLLFSTGVLAMGVLWAFVDDLREELKEFPWVFVPFVLCALASAGRIQVKQTGNDEGPWVQAATSVANLVPSGLASWMDERSQGLLVWTAETKDRVAGWGGETFGEWGEDAGSVWAKAKDGLGKAVEGAKSKASELMAKEETSGSSGVVLTQETQASPPKVEFGTQRRYYFYLIAPSGMGPVKRQLKDWTIVSDIVDLDVPEDVLDQRTYASQQGFERDFMNRVKEETTGWYDIASDKPTYVGSFWSVSFYGADSRDAAEELRAKQIRELEETTHPKRKPRSVLYVSMP